jgi:adenylate cyclase
MAIEIERKFLVKSDEWKKNGLSIKVRQCYLSTDPNKTVRVRIVGGCSYITIKGKTNGISRKEFEYEIPNSDAEALFELCDGPILEKTRYTLYSGTALWWSIDVFHGVNEGLVIAEIELDHEDQGFIIPNWVGEEVSHDPRYYNSNLINNPYTTWDLPCNKKYNCKECFDTGWEEIDYGHRKCVNGCSQNGHCEPPNPWPRSDT